MAEKLGEHLKLEAKRDGAKKMTPKQLKTV
jgi:hypothetical protein